MASTNPAYRRPGSGPAVHLSAVAAPAEDLLNFEDPTIPNVTRPLQPAGNAQSLI